MKVNFWLITRSNGSIKTTKNRPSMDWDEVAMKVALDIPNEMFQRPTLSASIKIEHAPKLEIEAETINNIQEVLKREGIDVKLTILPPEEE